MSDKGGASGDGVAELADKHVRFGWWTLFAFSVLGFGLETAHGLKIGWYLDAMNETRRLMFTLSHVHGTLLALVNIAYGLCLPRAHSLAPRRRWLASSTLTASSVALPLGFFLAGLRVYAGDPGIGIILVPPGAVLFLVSMYFVAAGFSAKR